MALLTAASIAQAQNPFGKLISEKLNKIKESNKEIAEKSGDYSLSTPEKKFDAGSQTTSDGKTSVDVEVKGIKIGMSQAEVTDVILKSVQKGTKCQKANLSQDDPLYVYGDSVIKCERAFVYFGGPVPDALFIFTGNQLKVTSLSTFDSENSNGDPLPEIARALVDAKFKVGPNVVMEANKRMNNLGNMKATWVDSKGNSLTIFGKYEKDATGYRHSNLTLEMRVADFDKYVDDRRNALIARAQQQQNANEQKKKNDL